MVEKNKVLIADNNPKDIEIIGDTIDSKYELLKANDAIEFMKLIYKNVDSLVLILLNADMLYNGGFDVIDKLNEEGIVYKAPIVLILEDSSYEIKNYGKDFKVADFFVKPFDIYVIKNRIANIIESYEEKSYLEFVIENQTMQLYSKNIELMEEKEKIFKVNEAVIEILGTIIEHRNTESNNHIKRIKMFVTEMLTVLSQKCPEYHCDERTINLIANASALHDIGKIVMPDTILLKDGKLTPEEFEVLKQHTVKGGEILEKLGVIKNDDYYKYCYDICMYHHERWDGNGYPEGLKGNEIPLSAQVVGIADAYDSLTNDNVYRKGIPEETAIQMILNGECGVFSDKILDAFKEIIKNYDSISKQYKDEVETSLNIENSKLKNAVNGTNFSRFGDVNSGKFVFALSEQFDFVCETNALGDNLLFYTINTGLNYYDKEPKSYNELFMVIQKRCHPDDFRLFIEKLAIDNINKRASQGIFKDEVELRIANNEGRYVWLYVNVLAFVNSYLELESIILCVKNIDSIKAKRNNLIFNICHDSVTKLWNGAYMREYVSTFIDSAEKNDELAMLVVDIDKFRNINKNCGYKFGNYILIQIAKELKKVFSSSDIIGRLDADIFAVLIKERDDLEEKLKVLQKNIFKVYEKDDTTVDINGGIGVVLYPECGETYELLLELAKDAVKTAKKQEGQKYCIYKEN